MDKPKKEKLADGRPTLYRPEYDLQLVRHMAKGLSYESFAGVIDVSKQSLYEWEKEHKSFSDAKRRGVEKSRLFWEQLGVDNIISTGQKSLNSAVWIFNMKNRFRDEWTDNKEINTTGSEIKVVIQKEDKDL